MPHCEHEVRDSPDSTHTVLNILTVSRLFSQPNLVFPVSCLKLATFSQSWT